MTELVQLIWACGAIKGMEKLVLMAWAAQLKEGNDTVYASKTTVGEFLGISDDTVLRRTQSLVKAGLMVDTGEQKQWRFGWTPVYRINVPLIMELSDGQPRKMRGVANCTPPQIAAQGSRSRSGVRSSSRSSCSSASQARSGTTDLRSAALPASKSGKAKSQEREPKTENREPKVKTCPKCGEPWSRDTDHKCPAWMDNDHDNFRDMPTEPSRMDKEIGVEEVEHQPFFEDGWKPGAKVRIPCKGKNWGCPAITFIGWPDGWCPVCIGNGVEAKQGKATPTPTPLPQPPGSAPPPKCIDFDE